MCELHCVIQSKHILDYRIRNLVIKFNCKPNSLYITSVLISLAKLEIVVSNRPNGIFQTEEIKHRKQTR